MGHKAFQKDLSRFDLWEFCRNRETLDHTEVSISFPRLESERVVDAVNSIQWKMLGTLNSRRESTVQIRGTMQAVLVCAHCGQGVEYTIDLHRNLVLLSTESQAEAYDENELGEFDDVVACGEYISVREWLEDEVLLSLPMLPKHEACNGPEFFDTPDSSDEQGAGNSETHKPFANLGQLIKKNKH